MSIERIIFSITLMAYYFVNSAERDTILQGQQPLRDWESLNSENNMFRLQFFSPGNSNSRYLGIFSEGDKQAVWIANRNTPIADTSGSLMVDTDGKLKIMYNGGDVLISNSAPIARNASATLQDDGNFVLREMNLNGSINGTLWQSFDYPTDTFLPGMKLGIDFKTGHHWSLTCWISDDVPSPGTYTIGGDPNGTNQLTIWWQGNVYWTSGLWHDGHFNNSPQLSSDDYVRFSYISNQNEKYLTYSVNNVPMTYFRIYPSGIVWKTLGQQNFDKCYLPMFPDGGCKKKKLPECRKADFWFDRRVGDMDGETYRFEENYNLSIFDCQDKCEQNCLCIAFASLTLDGTGCQIWTTQQSFFSSALAKNRDIHLLVTSRESANKWWIWLIVALGGTILLAFTVLCYLRNLRLRVKGVDEAEKRTLLHELEETITSPGKYSKSSDKIDKMSQVHFFSLENIAMATNNFSTANKLGEGGFGPVYKGVLPGGQEIAIKRLSRNSGQGLTEFKNEILLIAKLQHTNLVRLLGCCIQGQEKVLVYEYMPNKSLDFFLFDHSKRELLNWTNRTNIIKGVAQGLVYLHEYSRLKVIHCDLKASNILLDLDLNPKISNFGMARIFGVKETEANTKRIVGTYGYMSPEYAIKGIVSMKTDVFSFGVLLLEIVSGKKNYSSYHSERQLNLIGYAWEVWMDGRVVELMESTLVNSSNKDEIMRCINVGLLCVQDHAGDRPSMTDVVSMLTNDTVQLPTPKQPAFFIEAKREITTEKNCTNELTISVMEAR